jgi:gamma-glutamylcyclotransferase (GGCT)/AIG2-like uncharacterized protein YtfP
MPAELVFVYGSLRKGASNHPRMQDWNRVSLGVVRGRLVKVGWFPALVLDPAAETWVWGDIFRVEEHQLRSLLGYEGLSAGEERDYCLEEAEASSYVGGGLSWNVRLWAWTGPLDQAVPVPSGDWLDVECPRPAPLFTWVAGACVLAMPALVLSSFGVRSSAGELVEALLLLGGLVSPFAGWVSLYWAGCRRERAELLQIWVMMALLFTSIAACALLLYVLSYYFR